MQYIYIYINSTNCIFTYIICLTFYSIQIRHRNSMANKSSPEPGSSWPEPGPNWAEAKKSWGLAWELHIYPLGAIWTIAALYYIIFFVQSVLRRNSDGRKNGAFIMLSFQLIIHALTRCLLLFFNPYGSESSSQVALVAAITTWSLGTAGLTSAFGVLLLILLDATKLNIAPPKFQNLTVLIVITSLNFFFVLLGDIVVAINNNAKHILFVCQLAFGLWGIAITAGYFVAATRTRHNLSATFQGLASQAKSTPGQQEESKTLRRLIIKCYVSSFLGLCVFGLSLYSMTFGGSSVLSEQKEVDSWTWWALQTSFRLLELLMNLQIIVIALGTTRTAKRPSSHANSVQTCDLPM